jgi:PAS domain S-box-containing protein
MEGIGVLAFLALSRLYVMGYSSDSWLSINPSIVVLPLLLWLAARCPPVFAISGAFVASILVIWATTYGIGRYGDAALPIIERVKGAQAVVVTGTIGILVLTVLFVQRKKAEEGLKHRQTELAEAQRVARIGSWYLGSQSDVLVGSDELFRIYGFDPAKPPDDYRREFGRRYAADDLERLKAAARRAMETGVEYELDLLAFRNGTPIWLTARGEAVRNDADQIVGLRGTVQDITERKLAEQALAERNLQLALAGKAGLVATFAYDVKTERVQVSEGYAAIYGFPEGTTEIARSQWHALVLPDDLERLESLRSQTFADRQREYGLEYRIVHPDRGVRWIEARSFIAYDGEGRPQRVVGVNIDVTERRRMENSHSPTATGSLSLLEKPRWSEGSQ